jgi:hypothetical protein
VLKSSGGYWLVEIHGGDGCHRRCSNSSVRIWWKSIDVGDTINQKDGVIDGRFQLKKGEQLVKLLGVVMICIDFVNGPMVFKNCY